MLWSVCAVLLAAAPVDPIVARVGDEVITATEVKARAVSGRATPQVALDDLIAEIVLAGEAKKLGIKPPAAARPAIEAARRRAAVQRYLEVVVYPGIQVPEAEVRERFHQRGDQVRLLLVARATEAEARATLDRILKGSSFAEEAKTSTDPASKAKGGDLGWMMRSALAPALTKEVFQAPLKRPLGPVSVDGGFAVFLVQDRRLPDEAAYAVVNDQLRRDLELNARSAATETHVAGLVKERKGGVDEKAIAATGDSLDVSGKRGAKVVAKAGKVQVTYAQVVRELGGGHGGARQGPPRASPEVKTTLALDLLGKALLDEAAWKRFSKDPAVARAAAKAERAAVAAAYADRLRMEAPEPSSAEVEGRYQARKGEFMTPGGRRCFQLVAATEEGARKLAARVASGEDFAQVARESTDQRTARQGGLIGFVTDAELERVRQPDGDPALAAVVASVPPGELSAPIKTQAGYRVIRCEAHVAEKGATLDQVRHRLSMELKAERGAGALRHKADALRAGAKVQVDEAALAALSRAAK